MRIRIVILAVLATLLSAAALLCTWYSAALGVEAQSLYGDGTASAGPSPAQQARATVLWAQSGSLQQVVTPLVIGAMLGVTAVLAILAWRWELRAQALER